MTSTELQIIDSIPKLFAIQKELRKCLGNDNEQSNGYDFCKLIWKDLFLKFIFIKTGDFLTKWDSFELAEKHKKYDKYACNELNIFLYFKDPAYFEDFVLKFISNKIEKSFVDHFLLENED